MGSPRINRLWGFGTTTRARAFARMLGPANRLYYRQLVQLIGREGTTPKMALDVGTGPAHLLGPLHDLYPTAHFVGLDCSWPMLTLARQEVLKYSPNSYIDLVQGDAYRLPFRARCFDLVVCTGLIHHLDDLAAFFGEVLRVLAPSGVFVCISYRRDAVWPLRAAARVHSGWMWLWRVRREGLHGVLQASWTRGELEEALKEAGFCRFPIRQGLLTVVLQAHYNSDVE
jgi:SAM-dependent methyltransferase